MMYDISSFNTEATKYKCPYCNDIVELPVSYICPSCGNLLWKELKIDNLPPDILTSVGE